LLDIMMPDMDGFEVCRRLKAEPKTRDIPIIFLTALSERTDEAFGLSLGAVDYITKPFNTAIVKARVQCHLELKRHRNHLEDLVAERNRELQAAYARLKALDDAQGSYLSAIAHELRTPTNGVLGIAELAISKLDEQLKERYAGVFQQARERLLGSVDAAVLLAQLQASDASMATAPTDFGGIVMETCESLRAQFDSRNLLLVVECATATRALADGVLLRQSIAILLRVAQKLATVGTVIGITFKQGPGSTTLCIAFQCKPMNDALQAGFFDTFSYDRSSSCAQELGLNIPLAAQAVRAMGGLVELHKSSLGAVIRLSLVALA